MMWFCRPEFDRYARFKSHGSAREIFDWQEMCETLVPVPSIEKQRALVAEYKSIQNRINLNKQLIQKLEETAQAIYNEWFVTNKDEGWSVGKLSDLIEIKYGKAYAHLNNGGVPLYGSGGVMSHVDRHLYDKPSILIPRKGTLNNIVYIDEPFWTVDTMFYSVLLRNDVGHYVFYYLKQFDFGALDQGSAVPSMTTTYLNAMELDIPSEEILKKFERIIGSLFTQKKIKIKEIEQLEKFKNIHLAKMASV